MENKTKIISGGIGIVFLLSLGLIILPDDTHFCESRELIMKCDHLSPTNITCYPYPELNTGYKRCSEGWIEIDRSETEIDSEIKEIPISGEQIYLLCEKTNELIRECQELNSDRIVYKIN